MAATKVVIGAIVVVIGAGAALYYLKNVRESQSENIRILTVTPNMISTQVPSRECHQVTTSKKVKNKNSNFFVEYTFRRVFKSLIYIDIFESPT